jgi:pimeloyl-ACP methyl ester carboxylesterase
VASVQRPDGARIAFDVAGDVRRPAVLLLGGIGGDASTWRRDVPTLASELFVVVEEHRGIGRSLAPAGVSASMATYAEDALAVMDELRLERVHVYGHSFGAQVAIEMAIAHPERVLTLTLGASRPGVRDAVVATARAPLGRPWELLYSERFLREHPDEVTADRALVSRDHTGERLQAAASRGWDPGDRLAEISCPVLILHGSDDRLVDPTNATRLAERIPGARVVILQGAGHAYQSEMPERADAIVLDFIREHRTGAAV